MFLYLSFLILLLQFTNEANFYSQLNSYPYVHVLEKYTVVFGQKSISIYYHSMMDKPIEKYYYTSPYIPELIFTSGFYKNSTHLFVAYKEINKSSIIIETFTIQQDDIENDLLLKFNDTVSDNVISIFSSDDGFVFSSITNNNILHFDEFEIINENSKHNSYDIIDNSKEGKCTQNPLVSSTFRACMIVGSEGNYSIYIMNKDNNSTYSFPYSLPSPYDIIIGFNSNILICSFYSSKNNCFLTSIFNNNNNISYLKLNIEYYCDGEDGTFGFKYNADSIYVFCRKVNNIIFYKIFYDELNEIKAERGEMKLNFEFVDKFDLAPYTYPNIMMYFKNENKDIFYQIGAINFNNYYNYIELTSVKYYFNFNFLKREPDIYNSSNVPFFYPFILFNSFDNLIGISLRDKATGNIISSNKSYNYDNDFYIETTGEQNQFYLSLNRGSIEEKINFNIKFECGYACETCFTSATTSLDNCVKCKENKVAINNKCRSCSLDKLFYYNYSCLNECPKGLTINSENICVPCNIGQYIIKDSNECVDGQIEGYYILEGKILDKCYESCTWCKWAGSDIEMNCTSCKKELLLYNTNCYESCPDGLGIKDDKENNVKICTECQKGEVINNETMYCTKCLNFYDSDSLKCFDELPDGYYYLNDNIEYKEIKKCPFSCIDPKYSEQKHFCETYEHRCSITSVSDTFVDLNTDIIPDFSEKIKEFQTKSESEQYQYLKKIIKNSSTSQLNTSLDNIILLNQLLDKAQNDSMQKEFHEANMLILKESLTKENINTLLESDINTGLLIPLLAMIYSMNNSEYLYTEDELIFLQNTTNYIMTQGVKKSENLFETTIEDFISLLSFSSDKMMHVSSFIPQNDPDYNQEQFKQNQTFRFIKSLDFSEMRMNLKKTNEEISYTIAKFNIYDVLLNNSNIVLFSINISNIKNYLVNNDILLSTDDCEDIESILSEIKQTNYSLKISLPIDTIKSQYPNAVSVSFMFYNNYPLLNKNNTVDINPKFKSIILRDKEAKPIKLNHLQKPINLIIKRINPNFNYCIFYDEENANLTSINCISEVLNDDYIICKCNHLTDFSLSQFNPKFLIKDLGNLFTQVRFITSFDAFKSLKFENATVLYIVGGILLIYLILAVLEIRIDIKSENDFLIIYKNIYGKLFCNEEEMRKDINEFHEQIIQELPEKYLKEDNKETDQIAIELYDVKTTQATAQSNDQSIDQSNDQLNDQSSNDTSMIILEEIIKDKATTELQKKKIKKTVTSLARFNFIMFKKVFLKEFFICALVNDEFEMSKFNFITLFVAHLIGTLGIAAFFTECGKNEEMLEKSFNNRDLAVSIGTILILEIPFTTFECMLCKTRVSNSELPYVNSIKIQTIIRHWFVYFLLLLIVAFSTINTTWISLDSLNHNYSCRYIEDFIMSALIDCFVYQIIILFIKTIIYSILVRGQNYKYIYATLFCVVSSFPWIFNF